MTYNWKLVQELFWGALVAAIVYAGTTFIAPSEITDWRAFGLSVLIGSARAAVAFVISVATKSRISTR